ncbi:hypothetical protein [Catelliglobosispora koreensis]|uniref:hypothetical protein n=1 Tax=Catelliglobosispora koreensis TaxID=129052 RepID=UPI00037861ED|nr:hypothetical protein [Catelliglobosispora koreensis]
MATPDHGPTPSSTFQAHRNDQGVGLLEPVPSLVLDGFDEPTFASSSWMEGAGGSLVDHPLLRGLLLELPPKGAQPSPEWMDRWFEAARAVLDLIYNRR